MTFGWLWYEPLDRALCAAPAMLDPMLNLGKIERDIRIKVLTGFVSTRKKSRTATNPLR